MLGMSTTGRRISRGSPPSGRITTRHRHLAARRTQRGLPSATTAQWFPWRGFARSLWFQPVWYAKRHPARNRPASRTARPVRSRTRRVPRTRPGERARLGRGSRPPGCLGVASDCLYGAGGLSRALLGAGTAVGAGFLPHRALAPCDLPRPGNAGCCGSSAACARSLARCPSSFAPQHSIHGEYAPALQLLGAVEGASGRGAAAEHLSAAADLAPDDPLVHHELGLAVSQAESPTTAVPH